MTIRLAILLACPILLAACAPQESQPTVAVPPLQPQGETLTDSSQTIEDLMTDLVAPSAERLWNAVSYVATEEGVTESQPTTDDDWAALRDDALALIEAGDLLMVPNREILTSTFDPATAEFQFTPDEIRQLIADDPAPWLGYAQQLQETTQMTLQAIELRDVMGLQEFGAEINEACEGCHAAYWYRPPGTMVPR